MSGAWWWRWWVVFAISVVWLVLSYFMTTYTVIWGAGKEAALVLLPFLLSVPFLVRLSRKTNFTTLPKTLVIVLLLACIGALMWHISIFNRFLAAPQINDIPGRALQAIAVLQEGRNPYSVSLDPKPELADKWLNYQGLVYMPMTMLSYYPLGSMWQARGVLATNLILDLVLVVLIYFTGKRLAVPAAGLMALFLYLVVINVPYELFRTGATDIAAVGPLLGALLLFNRKPGWSGFLIGLSVAAKLFPGLLFLVILFPRLAWRKYMLGILLGMVPFFIFLAMAPRAVLGSAVMFSFMRSVDPTSWLYGFSPAVGLMVRFAFLWILVNVAIYIWWRQPDLIIRLGFAVVLIIGSLLSGPANHGNYQLWWIPFYVLLLAVAVFGWRRELIKCS